MSLLLLPLVVVLFVPASIGLLRVGMQIHHFMKSRTKPSTAFITTLCVLAAFLCLFTAPHWILGSTGWLVATGAYVALVAAGGTKTFRIVQFLQRELDNDKSNDVDLDGTKKDPQA